MSNENFKRELNAAFEQISGSPSPDLRQRVRSSISQAPARRGPYWIAAIAAAVIAVVLVGVLVMANPLNRRPVTSGPPPQTTSTPSPSASPSGTPSPSPSASGSPLACTSTETTIGAPSAQPAVVFIDALRTGSHAGYDRLTIEFQNGQPSIDVQTQSGTTFTHGASGIKETLQGTNGILVTLNGSDLHTSYSGPTDIKTGYPAMVEVSQVQDYEGVVQLGIGVNGAACYHAFVLTNPTRLVIDVQAP